MRLRPSTGRAAGARRPARLAAVLAGSVALALSVPGTALAAVTVVPVSDAQISPVPTKPGFYEAVASGGSAAVVDEGPASFLRLATPNVSSKATVANAELFGTPLSALTTLSYRTLIETPGTSNAEQAPSLNIEINPNKLQSTYASLVFEPIYTDEPVVTGRWQTWTPSTTPTGGGGWRSTQAGPEVTDAPNKWGFRTYTASFADVKAALPDATIISIGVNQGSGSAALRAGVDELRINDTTYDFENTVVASKLVIESGNNQSAVALKPFAQPLRVKVTGRDGGTPAPGITVTYKITGGSASFPGGATADATTDAAGIATAPTLTAGLVPGPVTVTATSGTLSQTFTLTVGPPPGPPVADLALTVTGVPASAVPGATITATLTVRNTSSFAATRVATALQAPTGLRVTAAPGGIPTGTAAAFVAPTLAPGAELTYRVTMVVQPGTRGARTIQVATNSTTNDPNRLNNIARIPITIR